MQTTTDTNRREQAAELLKERIYATFALMAVLVSIDGERYTPGRAAALISGTILTLWLASLAATVMARRAVYQHDLDHEHDRELQLRKHDPILATLPFPLLLILLAWLGLLALSTAITISLASSSLLLIAWTMLSARSFHTSRPQKIVIMAVGLAIGTGIVALKVWLGH